MYSIKSHESLQPGQGVRAYCKKKKKLLMFSAPWTTDVNLGIRRSLCPSPCSLMDGRPLVAASMR